MPRRRRWNAHAKPIAVQMGRGTARADTPKCEALVVTKELWFKAKMIALVLLGGAIAAIPHMLHLELPVVIAVGEAFVVAGILALTVDPYVKEKLLGEVLEANIGHELHEAVRPILSNKVPAEVAAQIHRLSSVSLVRRNMQIDLRFSKAGPEMLTLDLRTMFEVINVTDKSQQFNHIVAAGPGVVGAARPIVFEARGTSQSSTESYDLVTPAVDSLASDNDIAMWSRWF